MFNDLEPNVDYMKTIAETIKFLDGVGVLALQLDRDHVLMQNAVLNFFEVICRLHSKFRIPFSTPPSSYCVYRMLLSASCMPLSRMCAVLTKYKSEFDNLRLGISNKLVVRSYTDLTLIYVCDYSLHPFDAICNYKAILRLVPRSN